MIVYRLEDQSHNGPFFYRNGISKTDNDVRFDDYGLYAFVDLDCFYEESYIDTFLSDKYDLYEIELRECISDNGHQVRFAECMIIQKTKIKGFKS